MKNQIENWINECKGELFAFCMSKTKNEADAEDLFQNCMTKVFTAYKNEKLNVESVGHFRSVCFIAAKNLYIDGLRKKARSIKASNDLPLDLEDVVDLEFLQRNWSTESVRDAIKELPIDEREAVNLVYFRGFTLKETAQYLSKTKGDIVGLLKRGLDKMRDFLSSVLYMSSPDQHDLFLSLASNYS